MTPYSIINYYPTYNILDNILSRNNDQKINLFIDLKNNAQSIYMEHCVKSIVDSTMKTGYYDTSLFASLIPFLGFHKLYAAKRNIDINFYIFFEVGQSYYHKNINKKYKMSRNIDDLYGLDSKKRQKFIETLHANYELIDKALNKIPDTKVIKLKNLEADFIPYYLITRNKIDQNAVNIIYSNDHDMWQCCNDNTYVYSKVGGKKKSIIEEGTPIKKLLKTNETKLLDDLVPFAMSVMGDEGDDVFKPIRGIGPKTFEKIGPELIELVGGMNQLRENIIKNKDIFINKDSTSNLNKFTNKLIGDEKVNKSISKNMKQVDFELLSNYVENPENTSMLDQQKYIDKVINNDSFVSFSSLRKALILNRVFLQDDHLELLYWRKSEGSLVDYREDFNIDSV